MPWTSGVTGQGDSMVKYAEGFPYLFPFKVDTVCLVAVWTDESNITQVIGRNVSLMLLCKRRYKNYDRWQNFPSSLELKFLIKKKKPLCFMEKIGFK